jgi:shikimate kinase
LIRGRFIDLDELIEERTGKSPRTLYKEGPELFKNAEAEALEYLLGQAAQEAASVIRVAAAGGGIIDNSRAMALLGEPGRVLQVYLELSAETAWKRIRQAAEKTGELPPFLAGEDPQAVHRALHTRRAAAYRKAAAVILDAEGLSSTGVAREIRHLLPAWAGGYPAG